jgi:hypothetical protein
VSLRLILALDVYLLLVLLRSTPPNRRFPGIRIERILSASSLPSPVRGHRTITIISSSSREDISYWIIGTFLETFGAAIRSGNILGSGGSCVGAGTELKRRGEVCTLLVSLCLLTG